MRSGRWFWQACAVLGSGLAATAAAAQGRPSDVLIEPALYAVTNAPFIATVEWTWTEHKPDQSTVQHRTVSRVLRDSAGRQRFEDGVDEAGGNTADIRIYDVPTHTFTKYDESAKTALISWMGFTSTAAVVVPASVGKMVAPPPQMGGVVVEANATREPLGRQSIAGLEADGERVTRRLKTGKDADAITIVDEVWESPVWRLPVLHRRDDPRAGPMQAQVTEFIRQEPDAALFKLPGGFAITNLKTARGALGKVSPLPAAILDDNLAAAADRMMDAATAHDDHVTAEHERYELTMTDMLGKQHMGTWETWNSPLGYRFEAHSDGYDEVRVLGNNRETYFLRGEQPLRMREFEANIMGPEEVMKRLLTAGTIPKLKTEKVGQHDRSCAGDNGTAVVCFDQETGFVASAAMDADGLVFKDWKKAGVLYRAGQITMLHDGHTLLDARLTAADMEVPESVYEAAPGGAPTARAAGPPFKFLPPMSLKGRREFEFTQVATDANAPFGRVQLRVTISDEGKVTRADVIDADDQRLADAARKYAESRTLSPLLQGDRRVASQALMMVHTVMPGALRSPPAGSAGHVKPPIVLHAGEPQFSAEALRDKVSGKVLVYLQVDIDGKPVNVRVLRGLGHGLDEKAVEAARAYRFKPAMRDDGTPVRVELNVEVNFGP